MNRLRHWDLIYQIKYFAEEIYNSCLLAKRKCHVTGEISVLLKQMETPFPILGFIFLSTFKQHFNLLVVNVK